MLKNLYEDYISLFFLIIEDKLYREARSVICRNYILLSCDHSLRSKAKASLNVSANGRGLVFLYVIQILQLLSWSVINDINSLSLMPQSFNKAIYRLPVAWGNCPCSCTGIFCISNALSLYMYIFCKRKQHLIYKHFHHWICCLALTL